MEKNLLFINDSWHYIKRTVNLNNFTISYTREGGFKSQRDAAEAKVISDAQYEADLKKIKKMANIQFTFKEYVEYWLTEIFIKSTEYSYLRIFRRNGVQVYEKNAERCLCIWTDNKRHPQKLTDVPGKVPKIQLLSTSELKLLIQEASKHPGCYFDAQRHTVRLVSKDSFFGSCRQITKITKNYGLFKDKYF